VFSDFERRSKGDINDDVLCNRCIIGIANVTLVTHAMLHRVKSVTPLTIVELQNFIKCLVLDSPHLGRDDKPHDDTAGNGVGRGNGKRPRNNCGNGKGNGGKKPRPSKHEDGAKDKIRGKGEGKDKMR
jgi:hypothetical protein